MKYLVPLLFLFGSVFAQLPNPLPDFRKTDAYARQAHQFKGPGDLSRKLTKPCKTELEKVRSIFVWITNNIGYDTKEFHDDSLGAYAQIFDKLNKGPVYGATVYEDACARHVLKTRKAICDGYARLFKILCDSAGIKSEYVTGMAKTSVADINAKYDSNHAWNSVMIDKKWYLLDACWGSGFCDDSVRVFTKHFAPFYFLTDPRLMAYNHFPDNKKHFYYNRPPSQEQFLAYPAVHSAGLNLNVDNFLPVNGLITGKSGETVSMCITVKDDGKYDISSSNVNVKKAERKIYFDYTIDPRDKGKLTVFYKNTAILSYKVVIKE